MKLRYGFNEIDGWARIRARRASRAQIHRRLRLMGTKVVRVFVFDKPVPDPFKEWHLFRRRAAGRARRRRQADGDLRQVPPALRRAAQHPQFRRPLLRDRVGLHRAMGRRGGEGLVLVRLERAEQSRHRRRCHLRAVPPHLSRRLAAGVLQLLEPHLDGQQGSGSAAPRSTARSGRSGWTGSRSSWRTSTTACSASSTGTCMRTGGRRCRARPFKVKLWGAPDSPNGEVFQALAMAQTPQYEARAKRRCAAAAGPRHPQRVRRAEYRGASRERLYARAEPERVRGRLLCLRAHPPDPRRRGSGDALDGDVQAVDWGVRDDAYGLMSIDGEPTPAGLAKQLFAQHVRYGDWIGFPAPPAGATGRRRHPRLGRRRAAQRRVRQHVGQAVEAQVLRLGRGARQVQAAAALDAGTGNRMVREPFDGTVSLDGYGVAVVTNATRTPKVGC